MENLLKDLKTRMTKSVEAFKVDLTKIRTGRAHPSLLDHVQVEYYGSQSPLAQVANISVLDARTLQIVPWDKSMVQPIEKAIAGSGLGLNPNTSGTNIRVPLPPLTEERRKEMTKVVRAEAEGARVSVRNIRRDSIQHCKDMLKDKKITEDELRRAEERIQKTTDEVVKQIDQLAQEKEKELMEI